TQCQLLLSHTGGEGGASSQVLRHVFFFQAEDGIRDRNVTGVQTCALPILPTEEIEELGIITARGIDYLEEHQLQTTLIIFQFEAQSQNFTKIVSGTGETVKEAEIGRASCRERM